MSSVEIAKRRIADRLFQWLRAGFYILAFERNVPFKAAWESAVHDWEIKQRKGDAPKAREAWDDQYETSQWDYMERLDECARYAVIVGYIAYLKPGGAVLDVGCGEGILFERYRPYDYARYVGLDISGIAVAKLAPKQDERTAFLQADAEAHRPAERFDVIVFNEVHYYFHDPLKAIGSYVDALKPGGLLIVSTYTASRRAMTILRELKARHAVIDETKTVQGAKSWFCTVLEPRPAGR